MELPTVLMFIFRYTNLFCQTSIVYDKQIKAFIPKKFNYLRIAILWMCTLVITVCFVTLGGQILHQVSVLEFVIRMMSATAFIAVNVYAVINGISKNRITVELNNQVLQMERDLCSRFEHKFSYNKLYRCVRCATYFAIFYYCVVVSGTYLVNNILINDYHLFLPFFTMCVLTVPVIGQTIPSLTLLWLLRRQMLFLRKKIQCVILRKCCHRTLLICLDFVARYHRLKFIFIKCIGGPIVGFALFTLLNGSFQYYNVLQYVSNLEGRSLPDHLFMIATTIWLLSVQLQFVMLIIAIGCTSEQVNTFFCIELTHRTDSTHFYTGVFFLKFID